ncbi:hypothetical protein B0G80_3783 [Paraburkholderia sp. BL6669N2]|nr:hypothetical protein B0G80_3783 [Paraburkholderia sp. BL6669N2]
MEQAVIAFGQPANTAFAVSGDFRELTDEELLIVSGGGNFGTAIVGGLKGAVGGGIVGATGAAASGQPIGASGIAGMVSGGLAGAYRGFTGSGGS